MSSSKELSGDELPSPSSTFFGGTHCKILKLKLGPDPSKALPVKINYLEKMSSGQTYASMKTRA